jgi:hypothetical protein
MTTRLRNLLATCHEQVADAYKNGATLRQIGDVHSVSAGTVRNLLKELGIPLRARGRRSKAAQAHPKILPIAPASEDQPQPPKYEGDFS